LKGGHIRLLFLASTLRRGGPTTQLLNIVRYLDGDQFEPVVVTLSPEPADSMRSSFQNLGVRVESLLLSRPRGMVHRRWRDDIARLAGAGLDERCVIHSHGIRPDVISSRALSGLSRLATARNYPYEDYRMKYGPVLGRWMARRHIQAFRAMPSVVACSETLARMLRNHGLEPIVIRDGIDTSKFRPAWPAERSQLRLELDLPQSARVGVCVGSLIARKNPLSVVRAVRAIDSSELMMIFVGGGVLEKQSRRQAQGDERIRFTGQVDNVLPYLHAADFFVLASRSEGMPNAALEALACGLPIVLSDIDQHRELLRLVPSTGELFALDDARALSAAIQRAATPKTAARGLLPGQAAEILGAEQVSRRYQEIYLRLNREASRA
jgi:glycosyltransferase involved in cell wall biosynthesis